MSTYRVAGAVGGAAISAAAVALVGGVNVSAVTVAMLLVCARAAAAVLGGAATRDALGRRVALAPVWAVVVVVAAARAGTPSLDDMRGANAVAGPSIMYGDPAMVAAVWLAVLAALGAVAAAGVTTPLNGPGPRLDLMTAAFEIAFVVTLFVGPHPRRLADAGLWLGGLAVGGLAVKLARSRLLPGTVQRLSHASVVLSVILVLFGARA